MTQYKLIKFYPGHELGEIHTADKGTKWYGTIFYDAYPEFWQKVEEVDYEILKVIGLEGTILSKKGYTFPECFQTLVNATNVFKIYSVKRLSDGEVFTIGDRVRQFIPLEGANTWFIKEFSTKDTRCFTIGVNITCIKKEKTPLFTTEDGVEIFKGDYYYLVSKDFCIGFCGFYSKSDLTYKLFSTKEKAENYIVLNKTCLSLNEISTVLDSSSPLFNKIKELAKSKL